MWYNKCVRQNGLGLKAHPRLTREAIQAALAFAAEALRVDVLYSMAEDSP